MTAPPDPAWFPDAFPGGPRFEAVFKEHAASWMALARSCCFAAHEAEDALSEALLDLSCALKVGEVENLNA